MTRKIIISLLIMNFIVHGQVLTVQENPKVNAVIESLDGESFSELVRGFTLAQRFRKEFDPSEKELIEAKLYGLLDDEREAPEEFYVHNNDVRYEPARIAAACILAKYSGWPESVLPQSPEDFERFRSWYEESKGITRVPPAQEGHKSEEQQNGFTGKQEPDSVGKKTKESCSKRGESEAGKTSFVIGGIFFLVLLILWVVKK